MTDPLDQLEADCAARGVAVADVLAAANVAQTTWWRWKSNRFEPRASTIRRLRSALEAKAAPKADAA